jgi:DNA-binding transcriptional LysR family regulator
MDLRQLRHFIAVYETGSFVRAAEECCVSQPAISSGVAQLEAILGVTLFDRGGFGARPTSFGTHLYRRAKLISSELLRARDEISALRQGEVGAVSIGVGPLFEQTILPSVISAFTQRFPRVQITTVEGISTDLFRRLLRGELDFSFSTPPSWLVPPDGLEMEVLQEANDVTISASDHVVWTQDDFSLAKLAEYPWIISASVSEASQTFFDRFSSAGVAPPKTVVRTDSLPMIRELVREHGFLCVVSLEFTQLRDNTGPLFRFLKENHFPFRRRICVAKRVESVFTPAADALKAMFIRHMNDAKDIGLSSINEGAA